MLHSGSLPQQLRHQQPPLRLPPLFQLIHLQDHQLDQWQLQSPLQKLLLPVPPQRHQLPETTLPNPRVKGFVDPVRTHLSKHSLKLEPEEFHCPFTLGPSGDGNSLNSVKLLHPRVEAFSNRSKQRRTDVFGGHRHPPLSSSRPKLMYPTARGDFPVYKNRSRGTRLLVNFPLVQGTIAQSSLNIDDCCEVFGLELDYFIHIRLPRELLP